MAPYLLAQIAIFESKHNAFDLDGGKKKMQIQTINISGSVIEIFFVWHVTNGGTTRPWNREKNTSVLTFTHFITSSLILRNTELSQHPEAPIKCLNSRVIQPPSSLANYIV